MPTRTSWSVLLPCALAACYKLDDDDPLLQRTRELLRSYADISDACAPCVQGACYEQARACVDDPGCGKTIACQLKDNPGDYRDCLSELFDMDASSSSDPNGSWEGSKGEFGSCVELNCKAECGRERSDWECKGWKVTAQDKEYELTLSVGILGTGEGSTGFRVARGVSVQACSAMERCGGDKETDDAGTVNVRIGYLGADGLRFKLEPGDSGFEFPTTYYYPTHLGSSSRQPVSVYVFATDTIASAHEHLRLDVAMLPDAAQALILPDGCRAQSQPSATDVTVHLEGTDAPLPPCYGEAIQDGGLVDGLASGTRKTTAFPSRPWRPRTSTPGAEGQPSSVSRADGT